VTPNHVFPPVIARTNWCPPAHGHARRMMVVFKRETRNRRLADRPPAMQIR
jgi:hypothetical protein